MRHYVGWAALILALAVCGDARAPSVGAPRQLSSGAASKPGTHPPRVPNNWKIITDRPDPLTEKPTRYAVDMPKMSPVFHGATVTAAVVIHCVTVYLNKPSVPDLMLLFTGLKGIGHINKLLTKYRWDDGPVHSYMVKAKGKAGTRAFVLPKINSPVPDIAPSEDPISDIVDAKRLRLEVSFQSEGTVFVDFDVSGAAQAISAVACE